VNANGVADLNETKGADRNRWLALYVLCTGMLMIVLDITVVNVALPTIHEDLGFTQSSLAWVVNAYLIAFGGLLLLSGRFGDILGRKTVFMAGLGVFTFASLLCGVAQTQEMLVGARFLQGIGGAMTSAVILGMIVTMFPERREQAKAIGVYAFVASGGGSVGLLAGGILTESINWHWIFFINVPIAIVTAILAQRLIERDEGLGFAGGADIPGAALITSSLMLGVYTIVSPAAENGWGDPQTLGLAAGSLALLAAFLVREARTENPLIPLDAFRSRNVAGANSVQALAVAGMFGMFFLASLWMEQVLGYSALEIGLAFLPATLVMGTLSVRYTEPLAMRFGPKNVLIVGLVLIGITLVWFAQAPNDASYAASLLGPMVVFGFGAGLAFPALMQLAMSSATQEDAGLASGLVNTSAQVGGALGLAVLATLSDSRAESLAEDGASAVSALADGYMFAIAIGAALVGAAIALAVAVLEPVEMPSHDDPDEEPQVDRDAEPAYSEAG
jgi:EmrB/QacA subfamily drug resistance transporter